eukprot:6474006-Amphidinium_carterae.1
MQVKQVVEAYRSMSSTTKARYLTAFCSDCGPKGNLSGWLRKQEDATNGGHMTLAGIGECLGLSPAHYDDDTAMFNCAMLKELEADWERNGVPAPQRRCSNPEASVQCQRYPLQRRCLNPEASVQCQRTTMAEGRAVTASDLPAPAASSMAAALQLLLMVALVWPQTRHQRDKRLPKWWRPPRHQLPRCRSHQPKSHQAKSAGKCRWCLLLICVAGAGMHKKGTAAHICVQRLACVHGLLTAAKKCKRTHGCRGSWSQG